MADDTDEHDDVLELTDDDKVIDQPDEHEEHDESDEFHIELEGEEPPAEEPAWAKELRQKNRDMARELDGFRKTQAPKPIDVGAKPTIEGCDYDQERFDAEYGAWHERKRQSENADAEVTRAAEVRNEQWKRTLAGHQAKAAALPVKKYPEMEAKVVAALPKILQSALVAYTDNSAKVVAALATHPGALEKLAKETDPIWFAIRARELETKIRTRKADVTRKPPPPPEAGTIQRGSSSTARVPDDKKLKKLEDDARRTGNRTELIAYKSAKDRRTNRLT